MSAWGLGCVKTPWRKHSRSATSGGDLAQSFWWLWRFFRLEGLLARILAILGGSAPGDGRKFAMTMPSSPP